MQVRQHGEVIGQEFVQLAKGKPAPAPQLAVRTPDQPGMPPANEASPPAHQRAGEPRWSHGDSGAASQARRQLDFSAISPPVPHMLDEALTAALGNGDAPPQALVDVFQAHACVGVRVPATPSSSVFAQALCRWLPQLPARLLHIQYDTNGLSPRPAEVEARLAWMMALLNAANQHPDTRLRLSIELTLNVVCEPHLFDDARRFNERLCAFLAACGTHARISKLALHQFHWSLDHFFKALLQQASPLEWLDLQFNVFVGPTPQWLLRALRQQATLSVLDLRHFSLDDPWAGELVDDLASSELTRLDLRGCSASPEVMEKLRRLQQAQTRLTVLLD